LKKIRRKILK